jgi:hypothetical protein
MLIRPGDVRDFTRRPDGPHDVNWGSQQARGIARWYPLDGSSVVEVVKRQTATPTNVSSGVDSVLGRCASFSGSSYIDGDSLSDIAANGGIYTVAAWVVSFTTSSSSGGGGLRTIASNYLNSPHSGQFDLRYSPGGGTFQAIGMQSSEGGFDVVLGSTTVSAFTPYRVVMVGTGTSILLYVNSRLDGSGSQTAAGTASTVTIGADGGFDSRARAWNGLIGDVVISTRAWSSADVACDYQLPSRWDLYPGPVGRVFKSFTAAPAGNRRRRFFLAA